MNNSNEKPIDLELTDEQLDKEVELWYNEYAGNLRFDWIGFARHFAQWGAEHLADARKTLPKDLEEAARQYFENPENSWEVREVFIAGAKWQAEHKQKDEQFPPLEGLDAIKAKYYDDGFKNGFDEGMEEGKMQMMKEAVEGEVVKTNKHTSVRYKSFYGTDRYFYGIADKQFKPGDKVRVIVLPKEDSHE